MTLANFFKINNCQLAKSWPVLTMAKQLKDQNEAKFICCSYELGSYCWLEHSHSWLWPWIKWPWNENLTDVTKQWNIEHQGLTHCHVLAQATAPLWSFIDPLELEVGPGAREESMFPFSLESENKFPMKL